MKRWKVWGCRYSGRTIWHVYPYIKYEESAPDGCTGRILGAPVIFGDWRGAQEFAVKQARTER